MTAREARRAYVVPLIRRGRDAGPVHAYGSRAWELLPDSDPRKVAAVCIAAEAWATEADEDTIRERLEVEIAHLRHQLDTADAERFATVAADVRRHANAPTWSEVRERWAS